MKSFRADWRDPSQYPEIACSDWLRLTWEFVRRNSDYAVHVAQMQRLHEHEFLNGVKRKSESVLDGIECWPPAEKGETAKQYFMRMKKLEVKRPRIDKPCNTFLNRWGLQSPVPPEQAFDPEIVKFKYHEVRLKKHGDLRTKQFHLFLYPNEAAVRFRLDLPITEQIAMAREQLLAASKEYTTELMKLKSSPWEDVRTRQVTEAALSRVHYWLRCYDAKRAPKRKKDDDPMRRLALKSGPVDQVELFNKEIKVTGGKDFLVTASLKTFSEQASDFIEKGKYLLLLFANSKRQSGRSSKDQDLAAVPPVSPVVNASAAFFGKK